MNSVNFYLHRPQSINAKKIILTFLSILTLDLRSYLMRLIVILIMQINIANETMPRASATQKSICDRISQQHTAFISPDSKHMDNQIFMTMHNPLLQINSIRQKKQFLSYFHFSNLQIYQHYMLSLSEGIKAITSHPGFSNFIIYCIGFILFGSILIGLGPLIPYLSQRSGIIQTQYSILFFARAIGFTLGALSVRLVEKSFTYHKLLGIGYFLAGAFTILFNFVTNIKADFIFLFIAGIGYCYIDLFANVATIETFKGQYLDRWLQFVHGCFGIGGLLGPYIVYLLEFNALAFLSLAIICLTFVIIFRKSPEEDSKQHLLEKKLEEGSQKQAKKFISKYTTYFLSFSFLFIVGQEASYGSWISSYAVLEGFSTKEHATFYSSLYWISITFFRFAFVLIGGKKTIKIIVLTSVGILNTFLSLFLIFKVDSELGLVLGSIIFGFSNSALFPLLLSLPSHFGLQVSPTENSYFMLFASLGQGTVSVGTGYLMDFFGYNMLFLTMGGMNLIALLNHFYICKLLREQKVEEQKGKEIELDQY